MIKRTSVLVFLAALLLALGLCGAFAEDRPIQKAHGTVMAKDLPDKAILWIDGNTVLDTTGADFKKITSIYGDYQLTITGTSAFFSIINDYDTRSAIRTNGLRIQCSNLVVGAHYAYAIIVDGEDNGVYINCPNLQIYSESNFGISCDKGSVNIFGGAVSINVKGYYGIMARMITLSNCNLTAHSSYAALYTSAGLYYDNKLSLLEPAGGKISSDHYYIWDKNNNRAKDVTIAAASAPARYTVAFDARGHGVEPIPQTVWKNGRVVPPAQPTAEGYEFVYWVESLTYQNAWQYVSGITENLILHALWKVKREGSFGGNVTWKADGEFLTVEGTGNMDANDVLHFDELPVDVRYSMRFLTISEGVTSIEKNVFMNSPLLESAVIAGSVKQIGDSAFQNCPKLKTVNIPADCAIGSEAFKDDKALDIVRLPGGVTVGTKAFENCYGLWIVQLSDGVSVSGQAFANCSSLSRILLPAHPGYMTPGAFAGNENLVLYCPPGENVPLDYAQNYGYRYVIPGVLNLPSGLWEAMPEAFAGLSQPLIIRPGNKAAIISPTAFLSCPALIFDLPGDGGEYKNFCRENGYVFLLEEF